MEKKKKKKKKKMKKKTKKKKKKKKNPKYHDEESYYTTELHEAVSIKVKSWRNRKNMVKSEWIYDEVKRRVESNWSLLEACGSNKTVGYGLIRLMLSF